MSHASPTRASFYNPLTGIDWGTRVDSLPVSYYLYAAGEVVHADVDDDGDDEPTVATGWNAYEFAQVQKAFQTFSNIVNLQFVQTDSADGADFRMVNTPFGEDDDTLGVFLPPGEENAGLGAFNVDGQGWHRDQPGQGLEVGGYGFVTLIHEIGHGLGLAHPHDDAGGSTLFPGVTEENQELGELNFNQGINTMMSYNDGWQTAPHGRSNDLAYGWIATPMALDIAVLQAKYGANMTYNAGDDVYDLPDVNASGTYYQAIWDAGGNDTLRYQGEQDAIINLAAASLRFEPGGAGEVSYVAGVHGGYTIAHNVVIENAVSGSGNDVIMGNAADNRIAPGAGDDIVDAGAGLDTVIIASIRGDAAVTANRGQVQVAGTEGNDVLIDVERIAFDDGTLAFDLEGSAGQAYRLYEAAFGRSADAEGLGYWVAELDAGRGDLNWLAAGFLASDEFTLGTGGSTLTDDQFLAGIYANVLGRAPDAAGLDYWEDALSADMGRDAVLAAFSESAEHQASLWSTMQDGIWFA